MPVGAQPLARLVAAIDTHGPLAIAVSGGVDSMTLAHVAWRYARERPVMMHAVGPAVPANARARLDEHAQREGWPLELIDAGEQRDPRYRANPIDRCYYCKNNLYERMRAATTRVIASGTNLDDLTDFRPGLRAAGEHGVVHPFVEAALDKAAVYAIAGGLGLGDLERLPPQPCLASRVETGIAIDARDLAFIDRIEAMLTALRGESAVHRCRVTSRGIVVELGEAGGASPHREAVEALARGACADDGRAFAGVRAYLRGSAFVRPVADG